MPDCRLPPRRVEILCFPDVQLLDVAGPLQVFSTANDIAIGAGREAPYRPVAVAAQASTMSSAGLGLATLALPTPGEGVGEALDTLVVAGGWGVYAACEDDALVAWVGARAGDARRTASVCSGAFLLATAGLLDGRRAVTHWGRCAEFAARFPKVRLDPDPIFVRDGSVWTSAGVTAGIDLALALIEDDLGRPAALAVARQLVVFLKRPGGQSQFSAALSMQSAAPAEAAARFEALHAFIADNLAGDLSLEALARRTGMSGRSLSRHHRAVTGTTPARAVETLRIEGARRMLEEGVSVARTAERCGFGTQEALRRAFLRRLGINPQSYRARF